MFEKKLPFVFRVSLTAVRVAEPEVAANRERLLLDLRFLFDLGLLLDLRILFDLGRTLRLAFDPLRTRRSGACLLTRRALVLALAVGALRAAHRAAFFPLAVGAGVARRAVTFQLAVRAGAAHHAAVFPLSVGARAARRAVVFPLAVGARGAHRALVFPLSVGARVAHHALMLRLAVRTSLRTSHH